MENNTPPDKPLSLKEVREQKRLIQAQFELVQLQQARRVLEAVTTPITTWPLTSISSTAIAMAAGSLTPSPSPRTIATAVTGPCGAPRPSWP